jgi:crotonobetainyl-CoA:carnitine CoA-transferase CaiB-like acyl-CoA transferase
LSGPAQGPLAGIRVLDLTAVMLGPIATQILGDYGADVIKVEGPEGDLMRANGVSLHAGMGSIFLAVNRNKRSLALDLKTEGGRAVLQRLVQRADVLVHNMRIEAIERLGFGYAAVSALRPDIVYCAATGFAEGGPESGRPAFDDTIQAACGLASLVGIGRSEPAYVPTLVADKTAGMAVVNAVLAALLHRERTKQGQYVEVPMFETLVAFTLAEHLGGLTFDGSAAKAGYARLLEDGRKPAPTKDGYIALLPYTGDQWAAFFRSAGRDDLAHKYGIHDRNQRNKHIVEMYRDMAAITKLKTTAEWADICARLDIPAMPLSRLEDLPAHPQLKAAGLFQQAEHPSEGKIRYVAPPTRFAASPAAVRLHAPRLGEHSTQILAEAGYTPAEIAGLLEAKATFQALR